jgi:hypothetical protein
VANLNGDKCAMVEDNLSSKEQPMVNSLGSKGRVMNHNGSQDQEEKGLNTGMHNTKKSSGGAFGDCANLEGSGEGREIGQADEQLLASKEQPQLSARYLQKVCAIVCTYVYFLRMISLCYIRVLLLNSSGKKKFNNILLTLTNTQALLPKTHLNISVPLHIDL